MPQGIDSNGFVVPGTLNPLYGFGQSVAYTGTAGRIAIGVSTVQASAVLTSDNTTPSDGDTVTIGNKVYTFKTTLTPSEGQVLIAGSADAALLNLIRAINHTGTPDTDYKCAVAHTQVSAGAAVVAHAITITSIEGGTTANGYLLATTDANLSWSGTSMAGGVNDSRGTRWVLVMCTTLAFVRIGTDPTAVLGDVAIAAGIPMLFRISAGEKVSAVQAAGAGSLYVTELA